MSKDLITANLSHMAQLRPWRKIWDRERHFLVLPVCKLREKLIPGLMFMPPKGSIRSKIVTEVLKYLDQINVFERRQYGPTPFGLLDGHGDRLQLTFLEYINSTTPYEQRKWRLTLRTPNTTDVWQVGDSCH